MRFSSYQTGGFFDEMFEADDAPRPQARLLLTPSNRSPTENYFAARSPPSAFFYRWASLFNVYADSADTERIFPFDLLPRIIAAEEWTWLERGLRQRIHALNAFIDDIYHGQKILKDRVIPAEWCFPPLRTGRSAKA